MISQESSWEIGDKVRVTNPFSFYYGRYGIINVFARNNAWSEYEVRFRYPFVTWPQKFRAEDLEKISEEEYAANELISA